jgi:K+-transporting ATPase ATPase C chain
MWFNGRPDADNPLSLNGTSGESAAANYGPRSEVLVKIVQTLIAEWHAVGVTPTEDLVTTSGSGLDPDISPIDARVQITMVATARHLPVSAVTDLVRSQVHGAQWGFLGAPYVNLLSLNEALARLVTTDHGVGPT